MTQLVSHSLDEYEAPSNLSFKAVSPSRGILCPICAVGHDHFPSTVLRIKVLNINVFDNPR